MNDQELCKAKVSEKIEYWTKRAEEIPLIAYISEHEKTLIIEELSGWRALLGVIEKHGAKEFPDLEDSNDPEIRNFLDHHRPCKCGVINCQTITDIKKELNL